MTDRDRGEMDPAPPAEALEGTASVEEKEAAELAARAADLTRAGRLTEAKALRSIGRYRLVQSLKHRAQASAARSAPE